MDEMLSSLPGEEREALAGRIHAVRGRIASAALRAGRSPQEVTLVAVTKTVPPAVIRAAYDLGLRTFGENRVQEANGKLAALDLPGARWELIGHLQTNKAERAVQIFARIESVDSVRLAELLNDRAAEHGRSMPCLLEVNTGGEASKSGFAPEAVLEAARRIALLPHLRLEGLMTIAPITDNPENARPYFRRLRELRDALRRSIPLGEDGGWAELSMGMTDDFEAAIAEGATLVRIGRALFGERPKPQ
jgi:PLP dependent protein